MSRIGKRTSALHAFLKSEAAGGIILIGAAGLAILVANSPWSTEYFRLLHAKVGLLSGHHWINDALMAIFFLLVGLEIKREFVDGELKSWADRRLPVLAAAAGMIAPALVYLSIAGFSDPLTNGWAIPAATDIAFAIGVLALLGSRAPASLKLFLTTVAIVDDMGAVAIIALAYTADLSLLALGGAVLVLAAMVLLVRYRVMRLWPYLALGAVLWLLVYLSGVHATIAGVLVALFVPVHGTPGQPDSEQSPLHILEHALAPWVAYLIVPLFGFANAGIDLAGVSPAILLEPLPLGIAAGLFLGKQAGIFGSIWIAHKTGFAPRPGGGATWLQIYGVTLLAGIGFTMSLFIGGLAFPGNELLVDEVKIGVLAGSLLSALAGFAVLRLAASKKSARRVEPLPALPVDT